MTPDKQNKILDSLVNINQDAIDFYQSASEKVEDPGLEATFRDLRDIHNNVVIDLKNHIFKSGGKVDASGTITGKTVQFFGELLAKVSNDVDETFISSLEEAEDRCLHSVQEAMTKNDLNADTKSLLATEMSTLKKTHDRMKALKDAVKAA